MSARVGIIDPVLRTNGLPSSIVCAPADDADAAATSTPDSMTSSANGAPSHELLALTTSSPRACADDGWDPLKLPRYVDLDVEGRAGLSGLTEDMPRTFPEACTAFGIACPSEAKVASLLRLQRRDDAAVEALFAEVAARRRDAGRELLARLGPKALSAHAQRRARVASLVYAAAQRGVPVDTDRLWSLNRRRLEIARTIARRDEFSLLRGLDLQTEVNIASDGRAPCDVLPFYTSTGRAQSFGPGNLLARDSVLRGFVTPESGRAIVVADVVAEDFGVALALAGCETGWRLYQSGDIYALTGELAGIAGLRYGNIDDRTRRRTKTAINALLNGSRVSTASEVSRLALDEVLAVRRVLFENYRSLFPTLRRIVRDAREAGVVRSPRGWARRVEGSASDREISNFALQSRGADLLGDVLLACWKAGIPVSAQLHDALVFDCDDCIVEDCVRMFRALFARCSQELLGDGRVLRLDVRVIRRGERWISKSVARRFELLVRLLDEVAA